MKIQLPGVIAKPHLEHVTEDELGVRFSHFHDQINEIATEAQTNTIDPDVWSQEG